MKGGMKGKQVCQSKMVLHGEDGKIPDCDEQMKEATVANIKILAEHFNVQDDILNGIIPEDILSFLD